MSAKKNTTAKNTKTSGFAGAKSIFVFIFSYKHLDWQFCDDSDFRNQLSISSAAKTNKNNNNRQM